MTSVSSMHEAGHPKSVVWNNNIPLGWGGEGGGRGLSTGGHIYTYGQFMLYDKNHHNIVK